MYLWSSVIFLLTFAFAKVSSNPCQGINSGFVNSYSSCSQYYSCWRGVAFPKTCPGGRWFNPNPAGCHQPGTIPCGCPRTGIARVGLSCTEYILCINGNSENRECAPGTRFDREIGQCNLQELVPCEFKRCPNTGSMLQADPTSCRHYLVCVDGNEITRRECHANLLFDSDLRSCALPQNVDCGSRSAANQHFPNAPFLN